MKKKNNSFRKVFLISFLFLIAVVAAIQLYHPEIIDTAVTAEFQAPPKVKSTCYDCHSNETNLPLQTNMNSLKLNNHLN